MAEVRVKQNESLEEALKRFKKECDKSGIISEMKKREHYEKPSVRKKRKKMNEARRRKRNK